MKYIRVCTISLIWGYKRLRSSDVRTESATRSVDSVRTLDLIILSTNCMTTKILPHKSKGYELPPKDMCDVPCLLQPLNLVTYRTTVICEIMKDSLSLLTDSLLFHLQKPFPKKKKMAPTICQKYG